MNAAQVHLFLTSVPTVASWMSFAILGWATWSKSSEIRKVALVCLLFTSVTAAPTFFSGDEAGKWISPGAAVESTYRESHESAAEVALTMASCLGIAAALSLVLYRKGQEPKLFRIVTLTFALAASLALTWAGYKGALIHHEEARPGAITHSSGAEP